MFINFTGVADSDAMLRCATGTVLIHSSVFSFPDMVNGVIRSLTTAFVGWLSTV